MRRHAVTDGKTDSMRATMLRLTLLAGVAALPAWALQASAQLSPATPDRDRPAAATEGSTNPSGAAPAMGSSSNPGGTPGSRVEPPSAGAARGNEPRADSIRPDGPRQGQRAGQGVDTPPRAAAGEGAARPDAATGAATPGAVRTESGQEAVRIDDGTRLGSLESGANSFTEGQARSRIEAAGFSNVQALRKDGNGIWRGRAMQGGQQVEVGLDYRGNVATQ